MKGIINLELTEQDMYIIIKSLTLLANEVANDEDDEEEQVQAQRIVHYLEDIYHGSKL